MEGFFKENICPFWQLMSLVLAVSLVHPKGEWAKPIVLCDKGVEGGWGSGEPRQLQSVLHTLNFKSACLHFTGLLGVCISILWWRGRGTNPRGYRWRRRQLRIDACSNRSDISRNLSQVFLNNFEIKAVRTGHCFGTFLGRLVHLRNSGKQEFMLLLQAQGLILFVSAS